MMDKPADILFGAEHLLERDGCPVHYWVAGSGRRPLVAFTHGAFMDHRMFGPQVAALRGYYRVLTWDMRGHGASQPLGGEISYRGAAQDLCAILDRVRAKRAILVGQSMGAAVVQELVFRYPERALALALIGCVSITTRRPLLARLLTEIGLAAGQALPEVVLRQLAIWSAGSLGVNPKVRAYARQTLRCISKPTQLAVGRAALNGFHHEPDYRVARPFLLLCGERDKPETRRENAAWAAREPYCRYVVVPQAGHSANLDNPAFVNEYLVRFLKQEIG